jgi:hypothetical protein
MMVVWFMAGITQPAPPKLPLKILGKNIYTLFIWLISHQPAVLFSQNKPATGNQPAVLFSQNKPAPAISHQPNKQTDNTRTEV